MTDYFDLAKIVLKILEKSMKKPTTRRSFSKTIQNATLKKQNYRCNICGKKLDGKDFDHIDGDSLNNSLSNCQVLCLECHRKKTSNIKQKQLKLSKALKYLRRFFENY